MIDTQPEVKSNSVFDQMANLEHEQVVFCRDEATGLKAIIAIHNTVLGPSMGGTRMWNYATDEEAVNDVLRLSRGMTFKSALAGLNIGGGKAVIIGDARKMKNEALMRRFGKFVNSLNGKYYTAEDMNITMRDIEYMSMETPYVVGKPEYMGGSGDPSPMTAYGVYMGMKAGAKKAYGLDSLGGKNILVQGAGQVGKYLVDHLIEENANVFIADIFDDKIKAITDKHDKVSVVDPNKVFQMEMDIYAPCAMGATLNDETISELKCAVVAGAANNQLAIEEKHSAMLNDHGIIYCPDFLINSGGIANVYHEYLGNYNKERVIASTEHIYDVCLEVLNHSDDNKIGSHEAALELALQRIEKVGKVKLGE
ncbi:leucine dehydrogenase [Ekhidna lutea]|uniref:Leucine dehydrogenase n=1 Tax=Ekhidna lutea TaxID=447679 RepID=A0A239IJX3_EKHLU|nr:Glu/Leu/Phe/Val dehydrogenase dimerization domain-containing protein [Ekhidna lutea]SNS92714.1 leucine dehydrogenase [Ekhidna lutea]